MVRALQRKLLRDLRRLWAQGLTIALVVACGVAGFVAMLGTHESLLASRDRYYQHSHFGDVFAQVKRAPLSLKPRIEALPGVTEARLSVAFDTQLDLPGLMQPLTGRFIGLPPNQGLDRLTLISGRLPQPSRELEAVINTRFAELRGLSPGDTLHAILNGRRERVRVVGTVISPEYVYATRGSGPDDAWFGVLWIPEQRMAQAFAMEGAFNQLSLRLSPGASLPELKRQLDALLEPYGSLGSVGRDRQLSNFIVDNELQQQKVMATVLPAILLLVAAFILNVVMSRQVTTQRGQIAALRALGYTRAEISAHYLLLALSMALAGLLMGVGLSQWLGVQLVGLYADVFRFGELSYRSSPTVLLMATVAVALAATLGAWTAVANVLKLSPAQAMLPPAPPTGLQGHAA